MLGGGGREGWGRGGIPIRVQNSVWCVVVPVVVGEGENWRRGVRRSG